jgi:hypothetical protein
MAPRPARLFALGVLVAVLAVAAGCGTPSNLDAQEQEAFARECTSLLERNLANDPDRSDRALTLDGQRLDLAAGASFYEELEDLRGPDTFDLHDSSDSNSTRNSTFDRCKNDAFDRRRRSTSGTTTTTAN